MTPQDEATRILSEVLHDLTSANRDLKSALRRCQHACQLIGGNADREWFQLQLSGYPADVEVPAHRKIVGRLKWRPKRSKYSPVDVAIERVAYGPASYEDEEEDTVVEMRAGIDFLLLASEHGFTEPTGETKKGWSPKRQNEIDLERVRVFHKLGFSALLQMIETWTFNYASQIYTLLRYGNALTDIWSNYRSEVDAFLRRLGLEHHLEAIESGLESDNPQAWRNAVYGCRNLVDDVANHLWRDSRKTYEHLLGTDGKLMNVAKGKSANRLGAYIPSERDTRQERQLPSR